jgi:hypothetical protein
MAEERTAEEIAEDKKVDEFRSLLRKIKKSVIEKNVYQSQDPGILNEIQEFFSRQLYSILLPIVRGKSDISQIKNKEFNTLFKNVLGTPCSEFLRRRLEYYLHRDFIMFPFTYDTETIDNYNSKNSLEKVFFVSQ